MNNNNIFEIRTPKATKITSFKIDRYIDQIISRASIKYGFRSKSDFIRFIVCSILRDLGELTEEDEYLCYASDGRRIVIEKDDPTLLVAIANVVMELRGLQLHDSIQLVNDYKELLLASLSP
jgi:hypothetical protein